MRYSSRLLRNYLHFRFYICRYWKLYSKKATTTSSSAWPTYDALNLESICWWCIQWINFHALSDSRRAFERDWETTNPYFPNLIQSCSDFTYSCFLIKSRSPLFQYSVAPFFFLTYHALIPSSKEFLNAMWDKKLPRKSYQELVRKSAEELPKIGFWICSTGYQKPL